MKKGEGKEPGSSRSRVERRAGEREGKEPGRIMPGRRW